MTDDRRAFLTKMAAGALGAGVAVGSGASAVSAWTGSQTNSVVNQARPDDSDTLRIVKVEGFIMQTLKNAQGKPSGTPNLLCRIETKEGLVGWGEGSQNDPKEAATVTTIDLVKEWVIGQSAYDIERIWDLIFRARDAQRGASTQDAISAIDIALWDIVGQKLGVPVYKLLGGKVNDKIKIYTSYRWGNIPRTTEAYKKRTEELIAEGAIAGKYDPFFDEPLFKGFNNSNAAQFTTSNEWSRQADLHDINSLVEQIRGIREGGPEFEICIEAHGKFNLDSGPRICKAVEQFNPLFVEEPVTYGNPEAMAVIQRGTSIPIAAGERMKSRMEAREYIEGNCMRIFQPDVGRIGGITEFRKAVAMAETHWIPFAPHNPNGPMCLLAHMHLCTATPNFLILEEGHDRQAEGDDLFAGGWKNSRAYFNVPEAPGLGLKPISADYIRQHAMDLNTAGRVSSSAGGEQ